MERSTTFVFLMIVRKYMNTKDETHLMIDIETFGVSSDAPILSIGAITFNPFLDEPLKNNRFFYTKIELESSLRNGKFERETFEWWLKQDTEVLMDLLDPIYSLPYRDALEYFKEFCEDLPNVNVWANGSMFDIRILEHHFNKNDIKIPWNFQNIRDCRTIEWMSNYNNRKREDIERKGNHHNALDDAKYQAEYISYMCRNLKKKSFRDIKCIIMNGLSVNDIQIDNIDVRKDTLEINWSGK